MVFLFRMITKTHCLRMFKLTSIKKMYIFIAMAISSMLVLLVYLFKPQYNDNPLLNNYEIKKIDNGPKTILLANGFFNLPNWFLPADTVNQTFFENKQCLHTNCIITSNRKYLPSISYFDAVVFHSAVPFSNNTVPSTRNAEQLYVFGINESPIHTWPTFYSEKDFYNLTMTYRLDSDIFCPYGFIRDIETKTVVAPAIEPHWRRPPETFIPDETLRKRIEGKTKKAAWFVTHCNAFSRRENLARGIQSNFGLDIYGRCGNFSCPRLQKECYDKLETEYKFYLSFENSLCQDYVTEKLYIILERDVIPIVYGGADYNRFAPPYSYINANSFPTTSALIKYLKYLDSNPTEYYKYFWWKKYYEVSNKTPFCQICSILSNPATREKTQIYTNIREWWYGNSCNITRRIIFD